MSLPQVYWMFCEITHPNIIPIKVGLVSKFFWNIVTLEKTFSKAKTFKLIFVPLVWKLCNNKCTHYLVKEFAIIPKIHMRGLVGGFWLKYYGRTKYHWCEMQVETCENFNLLYYLLWYKRIKLFNHNFSQLMGSV